MDTQTKIDAPPKTGRYEITPDLAAELLARNKHNRPVSRREVERLKRILMGGQWEFNGEAIKFGSSGELLDGQHRLLAIAESGVSAELLVVSDLEDKVFDTLDQGRKRTGGDVLYTNGLKNHNALAAACAQLFRMLQNRPLYTGQDAIPAYGVATIFERHKGLADTMSYVGPLHREAEAPVIGIGHAVAYVYVLGEIMGKPDLSKQFAEGLLTGAGLEAGHPLLKLRQRIFDARAKGRSMAAKAKNALLAKVTGLMLTGEEVKTLTVPTPSSAEYYKLIPGLKASVESLSLTKALADLPY